MTTTEALYEIFKRLSVSEAEAKAISSKYNPRMTIPEHLRMDEPVAVQCNLSTEIFHIPRGVLARVVRDEKLQQITSNYYGDSIEIDIPCYCRPNV